MEISRSVFGALGTGGEVFLYTLAAGDIRLSVSSLGASWVSLFTPDSRRRLDDVILGFSTLDGYVRDVSFQGATVGRFANRIGNAAFTLDGKRRALFANDGSSCLHGGRRGFGKRLWQADAYRDSEGVWVRFELFSPDGDEGFPGNLRALVSYGLTRDNKIKADYFATLDAPSPVNLTNHSYFNLAGEGSGNILSHELCINSARIVEVDASLLPTGKMLPVKGTPFDFTAPKLIGRDIEAAGGYDHCYALETGEAAVTVREPSNGRIMRVSTSQPGVQFYSGNFLNNLSGKWGAIYGKHSGFCLETQHYPDSPNRPEFPAAVFGPGHNYHEWAEFAFDVC